MSNFKNIGHYGIINADQITQIYIEPSMYETDKYNVYICFTNPDDRITRSFKSVSDRNRFIEYLTGKDLSQTEIDYCYDEFE